jgi:RND family efflux transporter MFP subunit
VKTGGLLYRIDPRPYQAAFDQAIANRAHDQALLTNAQHQLARDLPLMQQGFATPQTVDQDRANVGQYTGAVKADEAAIEMAQLNLGYTELRAPFTGRIGRSLVHQGTLISAAGNSTPWFSSTRSMSPSIRARAISPFSAAIEEQSRSRRR